MNSVLLIFYSFVAGPYLGYYFEVKFRTTKNVFMYLLARVLVVLAVGTSLWTANILGERIYSDVIPAIALVSKSAFLIMQLGISAVVISSARKK